MSHSSPSSNPGLVGPWLDLVRRRWAAGLAVFVVVFGVVAAVVLLAHPVHRGEAKLRLADPPPSAGVSPTTGILGLWRPGGDPFANDLELLGSRSVAEGVVERNALHANIKASRGWRRDSLFVAFGAGRDTDRATFRVEWTAHGPIHVARTAPSDSVVGSVPPGEEASFGGMTVVFRPWREGMPRRIEISTLPFDEAVRLTRQRLTAERVRREANVLDLSFDHIDPEVARGAVEAWLEGFTLVRSRLQQWETRVTVDSLRTRSAEVLSQLREEEEALEAFQSRTRLVAPDAQSEVFAERYGEARTLLAEARREREGIRSLLARVEGASDPSTAWSELGAHPRFIENEMVGGLLTRLTDLEARRREIALRRTEESAEHRVILDQITDLDRMLRSVATSYALGVEEQLQRLEEQVVELDAELSIAPTHAVELGRLQRSVRLLTEIFVATEQRLRQEELREALTFANIQVIDPPALRDRPVWPRPKLGLAVGLLLASGFALLGMIVVERADGSVRRASQVRTVLGAPVLAAIPWSRNGAPAFRPRELSAVLLRAEARDGGPPELVVAPVDRAIPSGEVAGRLRAATEKPGAGEPDRPAVAPASVRDARISVAPALTTYADAVEATAQGVPVALLAVRGRTRMQDLRRAGDLLEQAGGRLAGVILVCPRTGEVEDVWR